MQRKVFFAVLAVLCVSRTAAGLTGSDHSGVGVLETMPPTMVSVSTASEASLSVSFSEPMLPSGVTTPANYAVSGTGTGTLTPHPDHAVGNGPYSLTWSAGEMLNGATVTVAATGVQDTVGNPIDPAANSASVSGVGIAPVFANLQAEPAQARIGDTVRLVFSVSEVLADVPTVTVDGHAAVFVSMTTSTSYAYDYMVKSSDSQGMADVFVSGSDLAGNMGTLDNNGALEIVPGMAHLPVRTWPAGVVLIVVGWLILVRRRVVWAGVLLAVLTTSVSQAEAPVVSNVTFAQRPNGGNTKVDIYYDLVAPNGPCVVTVSLSKNGGTDGYIYPVTSITGDISGVTTGTSRHIVWSIAADYPKQVIPQACICVTADDGSANPGLPVEMVSISAGSFSMGRRSDGDDATYGQSDELPVHSVMLSGYQIGQSEVTNQQYCDVLNWAVDTSRNYLLTDTGAVWTGTGDLYAGTDRQMILAITHADCNIQFSGGTFSAKTRAGLPGTTTYSMAGHPVVDVTWCGAAAFCNWLSEMDGLDPCYDTTTAGWPLTIAPPTPGGYRLPTEAEWERAAAWDESTSKHWIYGIRKDTLTGKNQANYEDGNPDYVNPLGLAAQPYTSPMAWFDGLNVSPNGNVATVDSPSPEGGYDLSGGVSEWCQDWYGAYGSDALSNPTGPSSGSARVYRGGSWHDAAHDCRTAYRVQAVSSFVDNGVGFRCAKTPRPVAPERVSIPAGTFAMGNSGIGDDATECKADELPAHSVTLSAYEIGKYEVTNQQYCDVLNWAIRPSRNYLRTSSDGVWAGAGDIYAGGNLQLILMITRSDCNVQFSNGVFLPKTRTGLPDTTTYSTANHPVVRVSWYGAVAFCNWLGEMEGLPARYDITTAGWPSITPTGTPGYRLPTEAEWERAAAWEPNASKHWVYGMTSDTLTDATQANYYSVSVYAYANPLGLISTPYTSPVGWFDGHNISPNGNVTTVNSPSPSGCCDMSGNAYEWCHDWFLETYYSEGDTTDPAGPETGTERVSRGGSWYYYGRDSRTACRCHATPSTTNNNFGFRIAK